MWFNISRDRRYISCERIISLVIGVATRLWIDLSLLRGTLGLRKLCLRVRLLYIYFICNLTANRDNSPSSPYTCRCLIAATAATAVRAGRKEEDKEIIIIYGCDVGYNIAYGAY